MKLNKPLRILILILPFLVASITILLYSQNIKGEFLYDDVTYFVDNDLIKELSPFDFTAIFLHTSNYWGELLPLRDFLYISQYKIFGTETTGYHVVSIFLFLCTAFVLFSWVRRIAGDYFNPTKTSKGSMLPYIIATVAMSLFLLHPVYVECVAYISGQKDVLSALFILLSLKYLYQAGKDNSKMFLCLLLGVLFHYFAMLSKISALGTFILVPIIWLITSERARKVNIKMMIIWVIANIPVFLWMRHAISVGQPFAIKAETLPFFERIPRAVNVIGHHISSIFCPWPISFGYPFNANWAFDLNFVLGSLFILIIAYFVIKKRRSLITLGLFIFVIYLLPVLNIFPDMPNDKVYNRYLAVPLISIVIILIPILRNVAQKGRSSIIIIAVIIIGALSSLAVITVKYVPTFGSFVASSEHIYRYFPDWEKTSFSYANALINDRQFDKAELLIKYETRLTDKNWIKNYLLGRISLEKKDLDRAHHYFSLSSKQSKEGAHHPYAEGPLAKVLILMGRYNEARVILNNIINNYQKEPILMYRAQTLLKEIDQVENLQ